MTGGHGGHVEGGDKRTALIIAVLALFLAIVETGAKSAQTNSIASNVEAANLWSFFQARTIRQTTNNAAVDAAELQRIGTTDPAVRAGIEAQQKKWRDQIAGWESNGKDGRKELTANAKAAEERRDRSMAAYHMYEYGSALLQVAIVVTSASIITSTPLLVLLGLALAAGSLGLSAIGFFSPEMFAHH